MKYSRTAIGLLTAQYRSVLKKCLLINLGLFALGAVSATPANAAPSTPAPTPDTITTWTGAQTNIDAFMDALHTWSVAESEVPDWDRQNGAITGWGMDQIFGALNGTAENPGILTTTQDAINLVNDTAKGNNALAAAIGSNTSGSETGIYALLKEKQAAITSLNKLGADLVDDSTSTNKFVTTAEKTTWNNKQDALNSSNKLDTNAIAFTPEQSSALNSGITAALKANYDAAYTAVTTLRYCADRK